MVNDECYFLTTFNWPSTKYNCTTLQKHQGISKKRLVINKTPHPGLRKIAIEIILNDKFYQCNNL